MGVMSHFSGRSIGGGYSLPLSLNPDPQNFNIITLECINGFTISVVDYPDCKNHEGRKVLVFKGDIVDKLTTAIEIDPHFTDDGLPLIARFSPTMDGISLANSFVGAE